MSLTASPVQIGTFQLPQVDLTPPEIAEEQRFRNVRALLLIGVLATLAVIGGLWWWSSSQVSAAQAELTTAQSENATLRAEAAKYAEVPKVYAQVATAQADLQAAMGQEIRYSFLLNDLSLSIPSRVWLTNLTVAQQVTAPQAPGAPQQQAQPLQGSWGTSAVAKLTFEGNALKYSDIAAWLDMLARQKAVTDPYLTASEKGEPIGDVVPLQFTSDVALTDQAYSNRYVKKTGN